MGNKKKRVLFVEDDHELRELIADGLSHHFDVVTARNGHEAIHNVDVSCQDCIILDIEMPQMNGIDFLRKLRKSGNRTPVIMATGSSSFQNVQEAADLQVQGYIIKPYSIRSLVKRIMSVVQASKNSYIKTKKAKEKKYHPALCKAIEYLENNYQKNLKAEDVGEASGASYSYLASLFKKEFGVSFTCYLNRLRVSKAKKMLMNTSLSNLEVMDKTGFSTEQHFYAQFRRFTGVTPKSFRK